MRPEKSEMLQNALWLRHRYRMATMAGVTRPFYIPLRYEGLANTVLRATRGTCWGVDGACNHGMSDWLNHLWYVTVALGYNRHTITDRATDNVALSALLLASLDSNYDCLNHLMHSGPYRVITNRYLGQWESILGQTQAPKNLSSRTRVCLSNVWDDLSLVRSVRSALSANLDESRTPTDILIGTIYDLSF